MADLKTVAGWRCFMADVIWEGVPDRVRERAVTFRFEVCGLEEAIRRGGEVDSIEAETGNFIVDAMFDGYV